MPAWLSRTVWLTTAVLVVVGVAGAAWRATFVADAGARLDPLRPPVLDAFNVADPFAAERPRHIREFDDRFAAHPLPTLAHVLAGGVLLALMPLQFLPALRNRHRSVHRWSGRLLVVVGAATALSGLYFGLLMPFGGVWEGIAIAIVGGLLLASLARAVVAIRGGQVATHREWMIRAFALCIAISVVRVVGAPVDLVMTPLGFRPQPIFVVMVWTGWVLAMVAGETWIRWTRRT